MIWVILGVGIIMFTISIIALSNSEECSVGSGTSVAGIAAGGVIMLGAIIATIVLAVNFTSGFSYDQKIEICIEENTKIEREVDGIVKNYLAFETDVYEQFKNESSTVLIQLFPELKANELVKSQLEIIKENNKQVKDLKLSKANLASVKWWLTFRY